MIKTYFPTCNIELIADNPCRGIKSQKVTLYKEEQFTIVNKQKDMFNADVEYWMNPDCWVLKITPDILEKITEG